MPDNIMEIKGEFHDVLIVSELRGGFPNVAIASDVDFAGLIAGDDNPIFLTIPVGKANVRSGNKRFYDEAWLQELERQTLANRPVGLMGHLSETERAHAMPPEAVHWLGTLRVDDILWAKGYLPPGEARTRIQRYKSQGKKLATSIDCYAEGVYDPAIDAYRMDAKTMKLGQIDIAPAERAGIADLSAIPVLTNEMQDEVPETEAPIPQEVIVDKLEILNGLTAEDARLLPKAVRDAILAEQAAPPEVAEVQEMRQVLGVDDKANLAQLVTEMRQVQETQRVATIRNRITELATEGIKIDAVRGMVTELVNARQPQSIAEAEAAYAEVAASAHVTELLKAQVQTVMGPRQRTPVAAQQGAPKYVIYPQEAN